MKKKNSNFQFYFLMSILLIHGVKITELYANGNNIFSCSVKNNGIQNKISTIKLIYKSKNLADFSIFPECLDFERYNTCGEDDVAINVFNNYAEVVSNVNLRKIYVNAIAYKKFQEILPDGESIKDKIYFYKGKIRIPILPSPNIYQKINPQAVHTMIQYWNPEEGRTSFEGAMYIDINPWLMNYCIKVYTIDENSKLLLYQTGLKIKPSIKWFDFEIKVNIQTKKYMNLTFDCQSIDLSHVKLASVNHPEWGNDESSICITAESLASSLGENGNTFIWKTHFQDIEFGYLKQ